MFQQVDEVASQGVGFDVQKVAETCRGGQCHWSVCFWILYWCNAPHRAKGWCRFTVIFFYRTMRKSIFFRCLKHQLTAAYFSRTRKRRIGWSNWKMWRWAQTPFSPSATISTGLLRFHSRLLNKVFSPKSFQSGVKFIASPGGSTNDSAVADACQKHGIALFHTGLRLFHH